VRKAIRLFPFAGTPAQIVHLFHHRVPDRVLRIGSFVTPNEKKGTSTGGLYEIPTDDFGSSRAGRLGERNLAFRQLLWRRHLLPDQIKLLRKISG